MGANCTVTVTFTPAQTGSTNGTLSVNDSAAGSPQSVTLTGSGSDLELAPASAGAGTSTVGAGQPATFNLLLTPLQGLTGTFTLACTGAPAGAVCTPNPASFTPSGASPQALTVTVTTTARSLLPAPPSPNAQPPWALIIWTLIMAGFLVWAGWMVLPLGDVRIRRRLIMAGLTGVLLAAVACGGGGGGGGVNSGGSQLANPSGTPAGKYTLQVTATSSSGVVAAEDFLTLAVN